MIYSQCQSTELNLQEKEQRKKKLEKRKRKERKLGKRKAQNKKGSLSECRKAAWH